MKLKEQKKFGILWLSIGAALFLAGLLLGETEYGSYIGGFGGGDSVDDLEIRSNGAEYTIKGTVRDGNGREIARKEYVLDAYDGGYTIRAIRPCAD